MINLIRIFPDKEIALSTTHVKSPASKKTLSRRLHVQESYVFKLNPLCNFLTAKDFSLFGFFSYLLCSLQILGERGKIFVSIRFISVLAMSVSHTYPNFHSRIDMLKLAKFGVEITNFGINVYCF